MNTFDFMRYLLNEHAETVITEGAEDFESKYTTKEPKMVGSRKIIPMEQFVAITVAKIVSDKFFNGPASPKFKNATLEYVKSVLNGEEKFPKITPTVKEISEKVIEFISEKYPFSSIKKDGYITVLPATFNSQIEVLINGRMQNAATVIPGIGPTMVQKGWVPKQTKAAESENREEVEDQQMGERGKSADVKAPVDKNTSKVDSDKKFTKEQMDNLRRLLYSKEMQKFFMGKKGQQIAFIGGFTNAVVREGLGGNHFVLLFGKSSSTGKKFSFYIPLADKKAIPAWVDRVLDINLTGEKKTAKLKDPAKEYSISAYVDKLYISHTEDESPEVNFGNMKDLKDQGLVNHRNAVSGLHLSKSAVR